MIHYVIVKDVNGFIPDTYFTSHFTKRSEGNVCPQIADSKDLMNLDVRSLEFKGALLSDGWRKHETSLTVDEVFPNPEMGKVTVIVFAPSGVFTYKAVFERMIHT